MASTLDITSGGRLELGIGAGWNEEECDAFGIELGTMRERFDRFEEGLAVLKSLLTNDRTTFDGAYYKLTEAMNNPKPLQSPLPICIGGTGKRRTLPLAARYASHWNCGGSDVATFTECRRVLQNACARIDRDPSEITCSALVRYEGDTDAMRRTIDDLDAAGADLAIISIRKSDPPDTIARVVAGLT
jgi:alkanesulfonate monooxygenase SsuD/methylene tetrahydromethanopterin reductase-like flavin-dependent oxidoreductase (luciferase family)